MGTGPDGVGAALAQIVADGDAGLGLQVAVVGAECARTWALGTDAWGRPLTDATLHPGYCSTKPVLALTVGTLLAEGGLALDDDVAGDEPGWSPITVAEVLAHGRADLAAPNLTEWRMADATQRAELWHRGRAPASDRGHPAYSELVGWTLLARAVARVTGAPALDAVTRRVLEPLGLADDLVLDPARLRALARRGALSATVGGLPVEAVPLLFEVTDPGLADCGPAGGGFVTARGLARLHAGCLGPSAHPSLAASWAHLRAAVRPPVADPVLRQDAGFQGGFMTDLDLFGVDPRLAAGAVGHVGAIIDAVGLYAPAAGVAVGIVGNGLGATSDDLRTLRRRTTRVLADATGLEEG